MPRSAVAALTLILVAFGGTASAQPSGDPAAGQRLAAQWCRSCHLIGPGERGPTSDAVPTFAGIADRPQATAAGIQVFLQTPHSRMPDIPLSRAEAADLAAYIMSLRGR